MQQNKLSSAEPAKKLCRLRYFMVGKGILAGIAAGLTAVCFRLVLSQADLLRQTVGAYIGAHPWVVLLWIAVLLVLAAAVTLLLRAEPYIGGSGIPQVTAEMQDRLTQKWWRVLSAKFIGGLLTVGAGLSLGREGPSIQMGAMAAKGVSQLFHPDKSEEKLMMTCGASAGLAAAFNAPLAGVLFSLEELHKSFRTEILLPALAASVTADFISRSVFGLEPVFDFAPAAAIPLADYWMLLLLGLLLGLIGVLYNFCVPKFQDFYAKIPWPFLRTAIPFVLAGLLLFVYPYVLGGGHDLVEMVSHDMGLQALLLLLAVKFLFSMVSFGSGVPGGIFLPLLVLGAVTGSAFGQALSLCGLETVLPNFVILGMAGMFSAIVRSPITGIVLIAEMTGSFSILLPLALVSLTAYAVADLAGAKPVYDILLERLTRKKGNETQTD